jgi:hypothetical protein
VASFLRSQAQHRSRLALVFSGSYGLLDDSWRPIIDLTARYELRPLDFAAATTLIRAPLAGQLGYDDAAIEQIWRQTGGRPFPIQAICHRLVSLRNRQGRRDVIGVDEVQTVLEDMAGDAVGAGAHGLGRPAVAALPVGSAP